MNAEQVKAEVAAIVEVAHVQTSIVASAIASHQRTVEALDVLANRPKNDADIPIEDALKSLAGEMRENTEKLRAAFLANTGGEVAKEQPEGPQPGDVKDAPTETTATAAGQPATEGGPVGDPPADAPKDG